MGRLRAWRRLPAFVVVFIGACLAPACGQDAPAEPDYYIGASAAWSWSAPAPADLGYTIAVLLEQKVAGAPGAPCRKAPASARLTVNGADVPLTVPDATTGCLEGQVLTPPTLGPLEVTARIEEDGRLVGEVTFDNLTPGTAGALVSPADGQVHAGDDVVIVPPPTLPTAYVGRAVFYPLDDSVWISNGIQASPAGDQRLLDGIHVGAPAFLGPAALILDGTPAYIPPDVACPGFAGCTETIAVTVGPFMLTGAP